MPSYPNGESSCHEVAETLEFINAEVSEMCEAEAGDVCNECDPSNLSLLLQSNHLKHGEGCCEELNTTDFAWVPLTKSEILFRLIIDIIIFENLRMKTLLPC